LYIDLQRLRVDRRLLCNGESIHYGKNESAKFYGSKKEGRIRSSRTIHVN